MNSKAQKTMTDEIESYPVVKKEEQLSSSPKMLMSLS